MSFDVSQELRKIVEKITEGETVMLPACKLSEWVDLMGVESNQEWERVPIAELLLFLADMIE